MKDRVADEVVLIVRPVDSEPSAASQVAGAALAMAGAAAALGAAAAGSAARAVAGAVGSVTGGVLDAVVPPIANAIVARVDLRPILERALDELDLTAVVIERVDLDAIVAAVDIDALLDRVPVVELADYVVAEINLPGLIQDSSGGVARSAVQWVRLESLRADTRLAGIVDRVLPWRRERDGRVQP